MTAVLTRPAGSEVIEEARQVFTRARAASLQWPGRDRDDRVAAVRTLGEALKHYDDLRCGVIPPWLAGLEPGGLDGALRMAADDAWDASEWVAELTGNGGTA